MVHLGCRLIECSACHELAVCAELWHLRPPFRLFMCARCLRVVASAVSQAAATLRSAPARAAGAERRRVREISCAALGEHRLIPLAKDDVIAYIAVTDWPPRQRELFYRAWCRVVGVDVLRSDVTRARQGRKRELNRRLFEP